MVGSGEACSRARAVGWLTRQGQSAPSRSAAAAGPSRGCPHSRMAPGKDGAPALLQGHCAPTFLLAPAPTTLPFLLCHLQHCQEL